MFLLFMLLGSWMTVIFIRGVIMATTPITKKGITLHFFILALSVVFLFILTESEYSMEYIYVIGFFLFLLSLSLFRLISAWLVYREMREDDEGEG